MAAEAGAAALLLDGLLAGVALAVALWLRPWRALPAGGPPWPWLAAAGGSLGALGSTVRTASWIASTRCTALKGGSHGRGRSAVAPAWRPSMVVDDVSRAGPAGVQFRFAPPRAGATSEWRNWQTR